VSPLSRRLFLFSPIPAVLLLTALLLPASSRAQSWLSVKNMKPVAVICESVTASDTKPSLQTITVGPNQKLDDLCPENRRVSVRYRPPVLKDIPAPAVTPETGQQP
jgi:hypothetical protein